MARERCAEILERYRQGVDPQLIARELGLDQRAVKRVVRELRTEADRTARARDLAGRQRPRFSDSELLDGLRRVAHRVGWVPTGAEYERLAAGMGLASGRTVLGRFDGWRNALAAAGLEAPAQLRWSRWDQAACWRALESVADQLGDPPRYRRYLELSRRRDDLPSAGIVRERLGLWSQVAAELTRRRLAERSGTAPVPRLAKIREGTRVGSRAPDGAVAEVASREGRAIGRRPVTVFSRAQLSAGVRAVGDRVGHAPSGGEYESLAKRLGLASVATVYIRFGNWSGALQAAGFEPLAPARSYHLKWDARACWNALESVADQLGDSPRYRRYERLAAGRDDLPSASLLRQRLGAWSQIVAGLSERRGAAAFSQPLEATA